MEAREAATHQALLAAPQVALTVRAQARHFTNAPAKAHPEPATPPPPRAAAAAAMASRRSQSSTAPDGATAVLPSTRAPLPST